MKNNFFKGNIEYRNSSNLIIISYVENKVTKYFYFKRNFLHTLFGYKAGRVSKKGILGLSLITIKGKWSGEQNEN